MSLEKKKLLYNRVNNANNSRKLKVKNETKALAVLVFCFTAPGISGVEAQCQSPGHTYFCQSRGRGNGLLAGSAVQRGNRVGQSG
jgi:hypothetical protein